MIRYVHIREEDEVFDEGGGFAFFCTVEEMFLAFDGTEVWQTWEEFNGDFYISDKYPDIERFKALFPKGDIIDE